MSRLLYYQHGHPAGEYEAICQWVTLLVEALQYHSPATTLYNDTRRNPGKQITSI